MRVVRWRGIVVGLSALLLFACGSGGRTSVWSHAPVPPIPSLVPSVPARPDATARPSTRPDRAPVIELPLRGVRRLADLPVAVGVRAVVVNGIRSVPLGPPDWTGAVPFDDHTIGLVSEGDRSVDIGQWHLIGGADTWAADLDGGLIRRIAADASLEDVAPDGGRLLLFGLAGRTPILRVVERDGSPVATLEGMRSVPHAAFLDDGSVAVAEGSRIGVWDADTGTSTWSDLPQGLDEAFVSSVGDLVVIDGDERSALVDPRSGRIVGEPWRGAGPALVAASPDGSRFAVAIATPGEPRGQVELRDATTGRVVAVQPGRLLSSVEAIAWPTDAIVIVMRAATGTEQAAVPEFHLADDFAAAPVTAEPFLAAPAGFVARRDLVAAMGIDGPTVLLRVAEVSR